MNLCEKIKPKEEIVLDYITHLFILLIVLSSIFFIFISKIEKKTLQNSISNEIKSSINNTTILPNPALGQELINFSKVYNNSLNDGDANYNQGLLDLTIAIIVCMLICLISVYLTMRLSAHKCPPMGIIFLKNILLFMLVGIVEYLFFINIAMFYIPVKPSYISQLLKDRLDN
jgi:ATP-dependent Zn protease